MSDMSEEKIVKNCIDDMVDSFIRVAAERDLQKSIVSRIKDETTVSPRIFRRMAKVAFKSNFAEEVSINEEFEETFKQIMGE